MFNPLEMKADETVLRIFFTSTDPNLGHCTLQDENGEIISPYMYSDYGTGEAFCFFVIPKRAAEVEIIFDGYPSLALLLKT